MSCCYDPYDMYIDACTFLLTCKKVCAVVGMWALAMVSLLVWHMAFF